MTIFQKGGDRMNKKRKRIRAAVSLLLVALFVVCLIAVAVPRYDAVELSGEEELAETGASHRLVDLSAISAPAGFELRTGIKGVYADCRTRYMSINERSLMTVLDSYSHTVNGRADFSTTDSRVAEVSDSGMITARGNGIATVTATDRVTGSSCDCTVYVGREVAPTQAPTVKPTDEPTEPAPTQAPTQAPTKPAPTQAPTQAPTTPAPTQAPTTPTTATLSLRTTSATVYRGSYFHVVADSNTTVSFSSSDTSVATVDSNGIVTTLANGSVTITAKAGDKTATCKLNVVTGNSVYISHSNASVSRFMSIRLSSDYGVTWSSSNSAVATVEQRGFVEGIKAGTAVITATGSGGTATCVVTVNPSNPVRFAYASPNCALKNQTVTLIAITDTMRTDVRFEVSEGGSNRIVSATSHTKDGDTYIWKGTTSFSSSGTFQVKAYSQYNGGTKWSSCNDGVTTAFVTDSNDKTTTVCEARRASDEVIDLMALFEGFLSDVYDDPFTDDPTVGYGRVIFTGETFYDHLTKAEAYAYLVQTVNNDGYADNVNSFFLKNKVKFNQQQFDALVCFVYNCGSGPLYNDDDLINALLDCYDGTGAAQTTYYINGDYVRIRSGPGTSYDILDELMSGTTLTVLSKANSAWWQVQLTDGTKGYVSSEYISSRNSSGNRDLNYINKQNFIDKLCMYHHAGGCVWGLLYRRVDETEIFFYGEYEANYGDYKFPIKFTCKYNESFHT